MRPSVPNDQNPGGCCAKTKRSRRNFPTDAQLQRVLAPFIRSGAPIQIAVQRHGVTISVGPSVQAAVPLEICNDWDEVLS